MKASHVLFASWYRLVAYLPAPTTMSHGNNWIGDATQSKRLTHVGEAFWLPVLVWLLQKLCDNKLGSVGGYHIAKMLHTNTALRFIDLSGKSILFATFRTGDRWKVDHTIIIDRSYCFAHVCDNFRNSRAVFQATSCKTKMRHTLLMPLR